MSDFFEKHCSFFDVELRKQVDLLWPREAERLEEHGLREAKSVLDLGTGNGYFLCRLARRHPGKTFTGVESSPSLAAIARKAAQAAGLSNMTILEGSCPLRSLEGRFDLVHARLALYSMPNRADVVRWARGLLNDGGRIAVIDVDDGLKTPASFWAPIVSAIQSEIGPGADRLIGRKLPGLLKQAGYDDVRFETQPWYSSTDLTPGQFVDFWSVGARQMAEDRPDVFGEGGLEKVLRSIERAAASQDAPALTQTCVVSARK